MQRIFKSILRLANHVFMFLRFHLFGATEQEIKSYADELKQVARDYGLEKHFPIILTEPDRCTLCRNIALVLMQPHNICGGCWIKRLHATIDRDLQGVGE